MSDIYNPSFDHPTFNASDYAVLGGAVNVNPTNGLTYGPLAPYYYTTKIESFPLRVFSSKIIAKANWNDSTVVSFGGSSSMQLKFSNGLSGPTGDDIVVDIQTRPVSFGVANWVVQVFTNQTGTIYNSGVMAMSAGLLGDTEVHIDIGVDKGSGFCDIYVSVLNTRHSFGWATTISNYHPKSDINNWFAGFSGSHIEHGQYSCSELELIAASVTAPQSIGSSEAFGLLTVPPLPGSEIDPHGISSEESFGTPIISVGLVYILLNSILSSEAWGLPTLIKNTYPFSVLPEPAEPLSGDMRLYFDVNKQYGEIGLADRDVERDPGLETAIIITLLTDRRADEDDSLPDYNGYKGGSWQDGIPVVDGYLMGTKLWLLRRSKTIDEVPTLAKQFLNEGFQWMIDDGVVETVSVAVERRRDIVNTLGISLSFIRPNEPTIFFKFFYNWEEQLLRRQ